MESENFDLELDEARWKLEDQRRDFIMFARQYWNDAELQRKFEIGEYLDEIVRS